MYAVNDQIPLINEALAGRYAAETLLGEGGWATVYLARDERHRRQVALKVLRPELSRSIGMDRFGREIEIAARLNHPHILPLLDSGSMTLHPALPKVAWYVMPYVTGESLRQRIDRSGKLPLADAVTFARDVADALDYAHRQGIVHRDIKPDNILVSEGHAVVADFGIARAVDEAIGSGAGITSVGHLMGTPLYMSPEQITGDQPVDGRSDIYSLACTLFEMIAGTPAWTGGNVSALMARRLAEPAPRIRALVPAVPRVIEDALVRALARDPAERFATAAEFCDALNRFSSAMRAPRTRRRGIMLAAGGAALAAAAVLAWSSFAQAGRAADITALAIIPHSSDSSNAYLSEGIQEGVTDLLRKLPQLRVLAPSVVAQTRSQLPAVTDAELGERLNVNAVLTWQLDRAGDSVRVRAELFAVPGADLLWSARLARPASQLAMLPGTVARLIADSLRIQLSGSDQATLRRAPTTSAAAYDLYVRGRRFQLRAIPLGASGVQAALDSVWRMGQRAIAMDSNFAAAWSLIGMYYFHGAIRGFLRPFAAYIDSGMQFSHRAIALDSALADPWVALLSRELYLTDNWDSARIITRRMQQVAPQDPVVQNYLGVYVGELEGRLDSAIKLVRRSTESDPNTFNLNTLGDLYLRARRNDSAIAVLRRAAAFDPAVPGPRRRLILALERSGRWQEAVNERRMMNDPLAGEFIRAYQQDGATGYRRVLEADIRARIATLSEAARGPVELPGDTIPPTREGQIAWLYTQLGDREGAMEWIMRERSRRPGRFRTYAMNPDFALLRGHGPFDSLVRAERIAR